jgi:hypothetical protein
MVRILGAIGLALAALLALSTIAFLSVGGMQMITVFRGPDLPAAESPPTLDGDLAYLRAAVIRNEHGASPAQFERFTQVLDRAPPARSVDEVTLVASQSLAAFENAHTTMMAPAMHRLPVRLHWTADALIIVKARPEFAALLGRRVISFGGKTPEEMLAAMPRLVGGGTAGWVRYRSEYFYSAPAALALLGATTQNGAMEVRTVGPDGGEQTLTLTADAEALPGDPFWDFRDSFPDDRHFETDGWVTLLHAHDTLPLYLQATNTIFLLRDLPEQRAIYVRMNGILDDTSESVAHFTQRVLALAAQRNPRNIIVDFRYNRGGDYTMALPLVRDLARSTPSNGRVYLIVGPNTFSAGLLAASQFKHFLPHRLTIVGDDVGDQLRFRGEGLMITLPASHADIYLGTAWDDVARDCGWFADCWPPNKFSNTWQSYRERRDLVMDAVFRAIASH